MTRSLQWSQRNEKGRRWKIHVVLELNFFFPFYFLRMFKAREDLIVPNDCMMFQVT